MQGLMGSLRTLAVLAVVFTLAQRVRKELSDERGSRGRSFSRSIAAGAIPTARTHPPPEIPLTG